jgi:hypothetical protein
MTVKVPERALFIAEFLRRLRVAAPGERIHMRVGDVFTDAEVIDLNERGGGPLRH